MLGWLIDTLEGRRPWALLGCLLLLDSKRPFTLIGCLVVLASHRIKEYLRRIILAESQGRGNVVEWMWEMNTLTGQLLACKDRLTHLYQTELTVARAVIEHESTLASRLAICAALLAVSWMGLGQLVWSSVCWYVLVKNTMPVKDFISWLGNEIRFLDFYTCTFTCTCTTSNNRNYSPNHLFYTSKCNCASTGQSFSLAISIWENERKWWPGGWSSRLLRSDNRSSFTDESGQWSYHPDLVRWLKGSGMVGLEAGIRGEWQYFGGDFRTACSEGEAETRMRCWRWERKVDLISDWDMLKELLQICQ